MVPHRRTRQSELVGETSRPGTTVAATKQQRHCLLSTQDVDKAGGEIVGKTVRSALLLGSKLQPHTDPMNGQGHELDSCCNSLGELDSCCNPMSNRDIYLVLDSPQIAIQ
eukprot:scaffold305617_cov18-Tisochrysis_lutea.AAC.1